MVGVVALIAVAVLANLLWFQGVRFAAERRVVTAPSGQRYDILVNREDVMPYTRAEALMNLYANIPIAMALIRHRRRQEPWAWAVRVRPSPYRGYSDLLHESAPDQTAAEERAAAIEEDIAGGRLSWPE